MKREEAIKDLYIIRFNPHWDELVNEEYWKELMEMAITALQNQPFWIPVSERLPEEPEENEIFDNKPLELYLVSIKGDPYPFRAFWNGKFFTNGWQKCEVTAWMPLPEPYKESEEEK